jgi:hypothetical protein
MHAVHPSARPCRHPPLWLLREGPSLPRPQVGAYQSEGSERVSRGVVILPTGARWFAMFQVPLAGTDTGLLTISREGQDGSPVPDQASLVVPVGEAEALLRLIGGIVTQALADGLLPSPEGPSKSSA